jgi:hypothetical protein
MAMPISGPAGSPLSERLPDTTGASTTASDAIDTR